MMPKLNRVILQTDRRPMRDDEINKIMRYADSVGQRLNMIDELRALEDPAIEEALANLRKKYPRFAAMHARACEKAHRDMQLVIRTLFQGALIDDTRYVEDKLLLWFRTMLSAGGMTPGFIGDTYRFLKSAVESRLSPQAYAWMSPLLELCVECLSDFPEPAVARV